MKKRQSTHKPSSKTRGLKEISKLPTRQERVVALKKVIADVMTDMSKLKKPKKIEHIRGNFEERKGYFLASFPAAIELAMHGLKEITVVKIREKEEALNAMDIGFPLAIRSFSSRSKEKGMTFFGLVAYTPSPADALLLSKCISGAEPTAKDPPRVCIRNATFENIHLVIRMYFRKKKIIT